MVHLRDIQVQELQRRLCQREHLSFLQPAFHHLRGELMMHDLLLQMHKQLETQFDLLLHLDLRIVRRLHQQLLQYVNLGGLPC